MRQVKSSRMMKEEWKFQGEGDKLKLHYAKKKGCGQKNFLRSVSSCLISRSFLQTGRQSRRARIWKPDKTRKISRCAQNPSVRRQFFTTTPIVKSDDKLWSMISGFQIRFFLYLFFYYSRFEFEANSTVQSRTDSSWDQP